MQDGLYSNFAMRLTCHDHIPKLKAKRYGIGLSSGMLNEQACSYAYASTTPANPASHLIVVEFTRKNISPAVAYLAKMWSKLRANV
eukprot:2705677-Pleurochrysis_carterae.AAC.4